MTLSVWRYAHLALALVSCVFISLASLTGIILAIDAVNEKLPPYKVENFDTITLAESLPILRKTYPEISEISVDHNGFVTLQGMDADDNDVTAYINPATGKILGAPQKKSEFIQWVTSLHRSLFLHEAGRLFVGVNAFLLLLIVISGTALIVQRQSGFKRFFGKITKDGFYQYYHVIFGRLMLIPVFVLALTGTYLSMDRFHLFGEDTVKHDIKDADQTIPEQQDVATFSVFKNTKIAEVQKIEFPFTDDADEYYTLKLYDREMVINQFTGAVLSEVPYKTTTVFASVSLMLHTGRAGITLAIILALASLSLLFFIYSGFAITLRRRATRIKNKYTPQESTIILLAGSENGSTLRFANAIHQQLLSLGHASYLAQANDYTIYPKAEHLILFTATHGLGDAPSNAGKLLAQITAKPQRQSIAISVVGFGSKAYPDFCGFAKKAETTFGKQSWAIPALPLHSVNDKSSTEFTAWVKAWSEAANISLNTTPALYNNKPAGLKNFTVSGKQTDGEQTFVLTLKAPAFTPFTSGDLLAIYPDNDGTERLYSIGKIDDKIQLVVKLHENGKGSTFLHNLTIGDGFKARIVRNVSFYLPEKTNVIMVANGTGIAPFLGMFATGTKNYDYQLYCGFRRETSLTTQFRNFAADEMQRHHLKGFHIAFSREANKMYVMDLIRRDATYFTSHLKNGGVVMLCGAIAMQQDVEATLDILLKEHGSQPLIYYKENRQIIADCY